MYGGGGGSERENGGEKERKTGELSYKHALYTHDDDDVGLYVLGCRVDIHTCL